MDITVHQDFQTEHSKYTNFPVCSVELPGFGPPLPAKSSDFRTAADGDAAVSASHTLQEGLPEDGPPLSQTSALKLQYAFGAGWKFLRMMPKEAKIANVEREAGIPPISPSGFACWLHGDGKGCQARVRFTDSTGQTFQPDGPKIDWKGWRYVTFPMRPPEAKPLAHWGGANDGQVHYPIQWDSIFLLDNASRQPVEGEIYLSAPTLIY